VGCVLGTSAYSAAELGLDDGEEPPELSIDPADSLFSVINTDGTLDKAFYITVYHAAINGNGGGTSVFYLIV